IPDRRLLAQRAAATYGRLRLQPEVVKLLAGGRRFYEVPFSLRPSGAPETVVRGRIDCLVEQPDGNLVILEFKTGQPRPDHEVQVEIYRAALQAVFPHRDIQARTFYP